MRDDEYYSNIYQPNSFMDPKSVVWRKCYNAKLIDFNAAFANAVSGLRACDIAVQTVPEQVAGDSFYTDEDLFNEIVDNTIITDEDIALFADDVVEWDS